tara:strand:- start:392 stop:1135 length:744 start_codon:yes stop_codon:yes gene_type:complete
MGKYMRGFLTNLSLQTHKDLEIVMDHNNPSDTEIKLIEAHNDIHDNIFHIKVDGVDPLGISWNRCIENASGDYLCIWNVDDLRTANSIENMAKALDDNPDVDFVYGDFTIVSRFGSTEGEFVNNINREHLLKSGMILGPFFMFRKSVLEKTKLFDEQLVSGNDFDFALRLAFNSKGMHIPHNSGYYLNEGLGLSTRPDSKQALERTVIELRYGLDILEPNLIPETKGYDIERIHNDPFKFKAKCLMV